MPMDTPLTLGIILSALVTGVFIHEATHFVVGVALGINRGAGIVVTKTHRIPVAFYVQQSRVSYLTSFSPLIWIIPFVVVESIRADIPVFVYLYLNLVFGVAGFTTLLSDVPTRLGLYDPTKGKNRECLKLVDYGR